MIKYIVPFSVICLAALAIVAFMPKPSVNASHLVGSAKIGTAPGGIAPGVIDHFLPKPGDKLASFSEGCFWGTENVFRHVKGVVATAVGFTGGHTSNPTYAEVCSHLTGHAESILLEYNPNIVSYKTLLYDFWNSHDPTTPDQQGPDVGSNYRSAIWVLDDQQMQEALVSEKAEQLKLRAPITTQVSPLGKFWLAESYHQQYDEKNGNSGCPVFLRETN